jgi:hypothetical protein
MGHLLHHQGLALDEEMIQKERIHDRERAGGATPVQNPSPSDEPAGG